MTEPTPQQRHRMRNILHQLELTSNGTTQAFNPARTGHPESRPPAGTTDHPAERWLHEWQHAIHHGRPLQPIIDAAQHELDHTRRRTTPRTQGETRQQLLERVATSHPGWNARDVALHHKLTVRAVHQARITHGRDPHTGDPLPHHQPASTERQHRARELHAQGLTLRQIAQLLNCDPSTIHRDLKAA